MDGRTDGQPENIMPPAPKGGGIKTMCYIHDSMECTLRFQEHLLQPWAHPCSPMDKWQMMLHIYMPKQFHWTWSGFYPPSGCSVPSFAKLQEHLLCPWASPCEPDWQMTMTLQVYSQAGSNELELEWICLMVTVLWHPHNSRSLSYTYGYIHVGLMGK